MLRPRARHLAPLFGILVGFALGGPEPAGARDLFEARTALEVGGVPTGAVATDSTNEFLDIPDLVDADRLQSLFAAAGGFDPLTQGFRSTLELRGLPVQLTWDEANSVLELVVPGAIAPGEVRFDVGAGQLDGALDQLESWFEGDLETATAPEDFVTDLLQALVEQSPVDPVAGNPNSLMTRMTGHDYLLGSEGPFIHGDARIPEAPDQTGFGLLGGYADAGDFDVATVELPFDHRWNLRGLPNLSFLLSVPLTATFTEGQWAAMGSLGLGFQVRPFEWWALTPMGRVGATGSVDVGAAALLYSATLTSDVHFDLGRFFRGGDGIAVHIVNQGGFAETADDVKIGDFELDYDLTNGVFRNGGFVAAELGDSGWGVRVFGHDVRWVGDDLFLESHAEIGAAFLRLASAAGFPYEAVSLNVSYLGDFGDYDGVSVMLRGRF